MNKEIFKISIPINEPILNYSPGSKEKKELCIGLHPKGRFDKIIDVQSCEIQSDVANRILNLRVFSQNNKMNLSIQDIAGDLLIISQFTLYADCTKGNRPSFINAAKSVHAKKIYAEFVNYMHNQNLIVKTGIFGEHMEVSLTNNGPVTLMIDTK